MSLWLCLRFDLLPLEALLKQHGYASDTATMVVAQRRVLVCDESASLAGVMPDTDSQYGTGATCSHQAPLTGTRPGIRRCPARAAHHLGLWFVTASGALARQCPDHRNRQLSAPASGAWAAAGTDRYGNEPAWADCERGVAETRDAAWLLSHVRAIAPVIPNDPHRTLGAPTATADSGRLLQHHQTA